MEVLLFSHYLWHWCLVDIPIRKKTQLGPYTSWTETSLCVAGVWTWCNCWRIQPLSSELFLERMDVWVRAVNQFASIDETVYRCFHSENHSNHLIIYNHSNRSPLIQYISSACSWHYPSIPLSSTTFPKHCILFLISTEPF